MNRPASTWIMIAVFAAFILMSDLTTKVFGVGLALAIVFGVTLVRMVLVPAVMSLLGHRPWWLPSWPDRLLPRIDVDGSDLDCSASRVIKPDRRNPALV